MEDWLTLTPSLGPNVKFANATGFNEKTAKQFETEEEFYDEGSYHEEEYYFKQNNDIEVNDNIEVSIYDVLKTINTEGKEILVGTKYPISNTTSPNIQPFLDTPLAHFYLLSFLVELLRAIWRNSNIQTAITQISSVSGIRVIINDMLCNLKDKCTNRTQPSQGYSTNLTEKGALSIFHVT